MTTTLSISLFIRNGKVCLQCATVMKASFCFLNFEYFSEINCYQSLGSLVTVKKCFFLNFIVELMIHLKIQMPILNLDPVSPEYHNKHAPQTNTIFLTN